MRQLLTPTADTRAEWHYGIVKLLVLGLLIQLSLVSCGRSEPHPVALPTVPGVPYRVLVKTFRDGHYADQPFHLLVQIKGSEGQPKTILRAEQCKDVQIAQTPRTLYVFYDEMILNGFSSFQYEANEPRVLLCDLHTPECIASRLALSRQAANLSNVCKYQTTIAT